MTTVEPFCDISNAGPSRPRCSIALSPTRTVQPTKDTIPATISGVTTGLVNSFDSEETLLTASESDWYSDEDAKSASSIETVDNDIDDSLATVSPQRRKKKRSAPPPIFFGTPCKAENDRRRKYQAKLRTRRILRKDSIELTRRKSGGWDSGNSVGGRAEEAGEGDCQCVSLDRVEAVTHQIQQDKLQAPSDHATSVPEAGFFAEKEELKSMGDEEKEDMLQKRDEKSALADEDPDATEEADWFGRKSADQQYSSSSGVELPSTPTRNYDKGKSMQLSRPSLTLSDADSSPGVALALHPSANRPSPLNYGYDFQTKSPYSASPAFTHSTPQSPYFDQENVVPNWQNVGQVIGTGSVLQNSPRKGNCASIATCSPAKVDVRQKLAAWADAKVKTPQSPEKREWDQTHTSTALSPSVNWTGALGPRRMLAMATQVPLPASPQKLNLSEQERVSKSIRGAEAGSANKGSSPIRQASNARQSKLPVPAASRLPRPFKFSTTKVEPPTERPMNVSVFTEGPSSISTFESEQGKDRIMMQRSTPGPSRSEALHHFSATPTLSSSSPVHVSTRHRAPPASSPIKSGRPGGPIVRDARLIASKHGISMSSQASNDNVTTYRPSASEDPAGLAASEPSRSQPLLSSSGVGGARRIVIGASQHTKDEPRRQASGNSTSGSTGQHRRLGIREVRVGQSSEANRQNKPRPMRRINDLIRKSDNAVSTRPSLDTRAEPSSERQSRRPIEIVRAAPPVMLRRSVHTQRQEHSSKPATYNERSIDPASATALPEPTGEEQFTGRLSTRFEPKPLPLSSAELSKLTSLHTRCNESSVAHLQVVLIRKQGEIRPPSPSSKFRKLSAVQKASTASKASRLAKEGQARQARAMQRSGRVSGGEDGSHGELSKHQAGQPGHRLGAGDEEVYSSPVRRISLKKAVRWHRDLFVGPSDVATPFSSSHHHHPLPLEGERSEKQAMKGCLVGTTKFSLDRFGNVPQAGKPLGSPLVTRKKIVVTKVVYDDDEDAAC